MSKKRWTKTDGPYTRHTPGPWVVNGFGVYTAEHGVMGKKIAHSECVDNEEALANAHILAASIDMLTALEKIGSVNGVHPGDAVKIARAAIKKAKGG